MTLALPYVFEVPAGPEQDEVVESIRRMALKVCGDAKIEAARHPLGMVRVRLSNSDPGAEEEAAARVYFFHVPHRAKMFARPPLEV